MRAQFGVVPELVLQPAVVGLRRGLVRPRHDVPGEVLQQLLLDEVVQEAADPRGEDLRSEVNSELNFPSNFEGLVLGCIDADFCK